MTPKEKASDLMRKFTKENRGNKTYNEKYCNGIKLALICVDEIIDALPDTHYTEVLEHRPAYWEEVKTELSLL